MNSSSVSVLGHRINITSTMRTFNRRLGAFCRCCQGSFRYHMLRNHMPQKCADATSYTQCPCWPEKVFDGHEDVPNGNFDLCATLVRRSKPCQSHRRRTWHSNMVLLSDSDFAGNPRVSESTMGLFFVLVGEISFASIAATSMSKTKSWPRSMRCELKVCQH